MGRVTLNDVSARAGVSRATASLVVRGSGRISAATSARVRQAMEELGYVYDRRAAGLRGTRSMTLGVVVTEIRNPFVSELVMALESDLHDGGYTVLVGHSHDEAAREAELLATMVERHVDGILLHPAQDSDPASVDRYTARSGTPLVLVMRHFGDDHHYVGPDNVAAGRALGVHLRDIGVRSVQMVGGPANSSARRERLEGLRQGLGEGVELDPGERTATPTNYSDVGERAMAQVFDHGRLADAVVGFSDVVTMGMYSEMYRRGLVPGKDVAVASFDDIVMAGWLNPPLTSVATRPVAVGAQAAALLMEQIAAPGPAEVRLVEPELRLRASTLSWRPRR